MRGSSQGFEIMQASLLLTKNKLLKIHFNLKIINKTKRNGAFTVIQDTMHCEWKQLIPHPFYLSILFIHEKKNILPREMRV